MGDGLGEIRFAGARGPDQKEPFGDLPAHLFKLLDALEQGDDAPCHLEDFVVSLVVVESDARLAGDRSSRFVPGPKTKRERRSGAGKY